ncbi:MAG: CoA-acylating methylmalonate-semialdehyde dehydrogenase, partial [SAR116 cluster bacterium]|nr:CoA-acylating methylmalonate-semialdehyde dehydrogenase [SAR116 cluster bacterium]
MTLMHYIGGAETAGTSGRQQDVFNPATGAAITEGPLASAAEVGNAVAAAAAALPGWASTPPARRAQVMFNFRDLIKSNLDELATLISSQHGKTFDDAKGEIARGIEVVEFACGIPHALKGEYSPQVAGNVDSFSMRQPVGVVAGITPFNFPAMVPMWMFPMALACGNTFVLKPSERDPGAPMMLARLLSEAGLPEGGCNGVQGDKEAVNAILDHPDVAAISFVGSTAIGKYIYSRGCANGKRVQALCGAKNHMIIMPDADMDQAVDAAMGAAYGSAGERCMAISAVLAVGDDTADRFVEQLAPKVRALKIGQYDEPGVEMGPVITAESKARIEGYIDQGEKDGADVVVDGRGLKLQGYEDGFFVGGTLLDRVTPDMSVYRDEIFGPVLSVLRPQSYDEARQLVMDHEYGNGPAIFTRDGDAARDFATSINIG